MELILLDGLSGESRNVRAVLPWLKKQSLDWDRVILNYHVTVDWVGIIDRQWNQYLEHLRWERSPGTKIPFWEISYFHWFGYNNCSRGVNSTNGVHFGLGRDFLDTIIPLRNNSGTST